MRPKLFGRIVLALFALALLIVYSYYHFSMSAFSKDLGAPGETYPGIGKDAIDLENLLVLTDELGAFGSSMSDSTRSMVTLEATDILVVLHCFENDMDLPALLEETKTAFEIYAGARGAETWMV